MTIKQQGGIFGRNPTFNNLTIDGSLSGLSSLTLTGGNLIVSDGNGIDFSATSGAGTSELFDDYEEGTWTVELYDADSAGNVSPTTTTGYYTKVGRVVHASFGPLNNIDTTGMTSGNTLRITLPFTPTQNSTGSVVVDTFTFGTGRTAINPVVLSGQSRARLFDTGDGVAFRSFPVSGITSGTSDIVRFSVTYIS